MAKVIVRVDTDAGIYGLGEVDDFMGVREAIAYIREYFRGRDPMAINPIVFELWYGTLPPYHPAARLGVLPGEIIACPTSSPTSTATGPVAWAISGVEMPSCDLVGKELQTLATSCAAVNFTIANVSILIAGRPPRSPTSMLGDSWPRSPRRPVFVR